MQENPVFKPIFVYNSSFIYYAFENNENATISRFVLNQSGLTEHLTWNQRRGEWVVIFTFPTDQCDGYEQCGPNGFIILLKEIKENGSCHFHVLLSSLPCHGFLLKMV